MENNRFENSFRDAFEGAELSPSEGVWTNVELSLEKKSGGQLKRNLLLFQLLAAASVIFACGVGALYFLESKSGRTKELVSEASAGKDGLNHELKKKEYAGAGKKDLSGQPAESKTPEYRMADNNINKLQARTSISKSDRTGNSRTDDVTVNDIAIDEKEASSEVYPIKKRDLASFARTAPPSLILPQAEKQVEPDAVMLMMARLKDEEKKYEEDEKKNPNENMWASLGFGAGSYRPNRHALNSSSSVTGESYSAGVNVAGKISRRIILQGGVSYLSQNADFTSTSANKGIATLSEYNSTSSDIFNGVVLGRSPYVVNSSLQFVSIPLQAGFLVVDRTFGIQVNGGIATDLFINNTLSTEEGDYQKVTQGAGKDSPYRTVNFSGLLGTEFSYRLADHYRISLNPGLRYSLNSIYKEEIAATITPVTFDVSLRFRYIFK